MIKTFSMLATATMLGSAFAAEHTVSEGLFEKKVDLVGIAKPKNAAQISINPKVWKDFVVKDVVAHGTLVKKGDPIIWIDTEAADNYLKEQEKERALDAIRFASAKQDLEDLRGATKRGLEKAKQDFEREQSDYKHYLEVLMPHNKKGYELDLEASSWSLELAEEELRQLLKMYEEDGLTEETEEIIIHRHQNSVKYQKYRKVQEEEKAKRGLAVKFDREVADRKRKNEQAAIEYAKKKRSLEKALQEKEIAFQKLELSEAKKAKSFAEAKADRKAMDIVAPADGYVYFGEFKGNHWKRDIANKFLKKGLKLPLQRTLVTVVPAGAEMELTAYADSSAARALSSASVGQLRVNSEPFKRFESKVTSIDTVPNVSDTWQVNLSSELPKGVELLAGEGVKVSFWVYKNEKAITVPTSALTEESNGTFTVELKMAEGENKKQVVSLGKSANGSVEVLSGLSVGQVIQTKDK